MLFLLEAFSQLNQKSSSGFTLLKLPLLARNLVFALVDKKDLISLALTSHQTRHSLKLSDEKIKSVKIYFRALFDRSHAIVIFDWTRGKTEFFCTEKGFKFFDWFRPMGAQEVENTWLRTEFSSPFENSLDALRFLYSTFRINKDVNFFIVYKKSGISFEDIISNPELKNWKFLEYKSRDITKEHLDFIMESANYSRQIEIFCDIPKDYRHENKFLFERCVYHDARWIVIEDLLKIENAKTIILHRTNLSGTDFKELIHHWARSKTDMFFWLQICEETDIDQVDGLLDGLVAVEIVDRSISFTLAKTTFPTRKRQILAIQQMEYGLLLAAWSTDGRSDEYCVETEKLFESAYKILQALERKEELEKNVDRNRMKMQAAMEELGKLNVRFEDGKAKWI